MEYLSSARISYTKKEILEFKTNGSFVDSNVFTSSSFGIGNQASCGLINIDYSNKNNAKSTIRPRSNNLIATLNTRTLISSWKLSELIYYCIKKDIGCLAIQEHRRYFEVKPDGDPICHERLGNGWWFVYTSAFKEGATGGVGFLLSHKYYSNLCSINSFSLRILQIKLKGISDAFTTSLFSIYSPTSAESTPEEDVVSFYSDLSIAVESIPNRDLLFILGDFNAMLLRSNEYPNCANTTENRNSQYLKEFLFQFNLTAASLCFTKTRASRSTFYGPNNRCVTLDYILVRKKWKRCITDCNHKCPPISSDHVIVIAKVSWKLKNNTNKHSKKKQYSSILEDSDVRAKVVGKVKAGLLSANSDSSYSAFTKYVRESLDAHVPNVPKSTSRAPWEDEELCTFRAKFRSAQLLAKLNPTDANKSDFKNRAKQFSELYVSKQEKFLNSCCEDIMKLHDSNHQSKAVWKAVNQISGRGRSSVRGVISAESDKEKEGLWFNHFEKLLSPSLSGSDAPDLIGIHSDFMKCTFNTDLFTMVELQCAIQRLSCGKACGLDEMVAEALKLDELHPYLLVLLNSIYVEKTVPSEWLVSILVPVFKKGSAADCNNYRGIALMSLVAKVYNRLLLQRLSSGLDKNLRYSQNGFRSLRSTSQHVLTLRRIIEEVRDSELGKLVLVFIDFSKAFDSVSWDWIRAILLHYNVPIALVDVIMSLYAGAKAKVRYDTDKFTDYISLSVGVLQGDTLAPYLFVIVMDFILRTALDGESSLGLKIKNGTTRRYPAKYLTDLAYADDITLITESAANAQTALSAVERVARRIGLNVNVPKTEFILVGCWDSPVVLRLTKGPIKQVDDFKYLGSWLMDCSKDFKVREALAWKACTKLVKIWKSKAISRNVKLNLFLACVESTLLYNAVTWTMTNTLEKRLDGCYTKLLRFALGYKWSDFVSNAELYGSLKCVSKRLLERKLRFAAHCQRATDQPVSELLFWDHSRLVQGKCSRGAGARPNYAKRLLKECSSVVQSDVELAKLMQDRVEWDKRVRIFVRENYN